MARFFSANHNSLLHIATNEIASFFIDHRSHQMAFFRAKAGQKAGFHVMLKYFEIKKAFRYYIRQIVIYLTIIRLRLSEYCRKIPETKSRGIEYSIFLIIFSF